MTSWWHSQVSTVVSTTCNCATRRIFGSMPRATATHVRSIILPPRAGCPGCRRHEDVSTQPAGAVVQAIKYRCRRETLRDSLQCPRRAPPVAIYGPVYGPPAPGHGLYARGLAE